MKIWVGEQFILNDTLWRKDIENKRNMNIVYT